MESIEVKGIEREEFEVIAVGVCYATVCTRLSDEAAAEQLNGLHPTGLDHGWSVCEDTHFASGHTNPCQCPDHEENRHVLFSC